MRLVRSARGIAFILVLFIYALGVTAVQDAPRPPCDRVSPLPKYPASGARPAITTWTKEELPRWTPNTCMGWPASEQFRFIVALAGSIQHEGNSDTLLARFGSVSAMRGLLYWSVSDEAWRVLINDAAALVGPDAKRRRPDFSPADMTRGVSLYYVQDDSRSSGMVVYRMRILERTQSRIVIQTENVGPVRAVLVTLFPPGSLQATYFLDRLTPEVWGFYGISGTTDDASRFVAGHEESYIHRAVALYRFLIGIAGDAGPPGGR